jgi:hypothetical protein
VPTKARRTQRWYTGLTTTAKRLTTNTRMNTGVRDNDEKCYSWGRRVLREN